MLWANKKLEEGKRSQRVEVYHVKQFREDRLNDIKVL